MRHVNALGMNLGRKEKGRGKEEGREREREVSTEEIQSDRCDQNKLLFLSSVHDTPGIMTT